MTLEEASKKSGFAVWTLQKFARQGEFGASKPRGNRGGWNVEEASFNSFLKRRRIKTANPLLKSQINKGRA